MAVKVVRRRDLTFWEKLYVPQILCGLKITFTHFFRNLFLHTAHSLGRFKNLPASATIQFPEELRPLMSRFRYDQLMSLGWKGLFPIAVVNVVVTAVVLVFFGKAS